MKPSADFPTPESWLEHRVSYGETDAMKVVYYGEYMHYFERARGLYIRERGMSYAEVEQRGIFLPIRECGARYRKPLRYEDLPQIRVGISEWRRASMTFAYEIWNEGRDTLHATGFTQHACITPEGRPVPMPDWLKELFV